MAITQVSTSVLKDGAVTSAKLDTNIAITGDLTVDTNTLFVDSSTNSVGIGTDSPATKMHLEGLNPKFTITNTNTTATGYHGIIFESLDGAGFTTQTLGQIDFITSAGATGLSARIEAEMSNSNGAGNIVFSAGAAGSASERMRIRGGAVSFRDTSNNEAFYWNASTARLGIGTGSSPNARLNVKSTDSTTDQITLTHSGNTVNLVAIGQESGHGSLILRNNSGVNKVRLSAAGNTSYILDSNVGIGTASPIAKLHLVSDDTTASAIKTLVLGGGTSVDGNGQYIQFSSSSNDALGSQIAGTRVGAGASSDLRFSTTSSTSVVTERLRIDSSGRVGIGTTSPASKLHVQNNYSYETSTTTHNNVHIRLGENTQDNYITNIDGHMLLSTSPFKGAGRVFLDDGATKSSSAFFYGRNTGDFAIFTGSGTTGTIITETPKLYIKNTGNVGIGTTSPADNLQVNGGVTFGSDTTLSHRSRIYESFGLNIDSGAAGGGRPLILRTNNTERVRIDSSGNVGIGTTSPVAKLDVVGQIKASSGFTTDNVAKTYSWRGSNTGNSGTIYKHICNLSLIGHSTRVKITGTGTTSYGAGSALTGVFTILMQVQNNNALQGTWFTEGGSAPITNVYIIDNGSYNYSVYIQVGSYSEYALEAIVSQGQLSTFWTTSTPGGGASLTEQWNINNKVYVNSTGNVGIGISSPPNKLTVSGDGGGSAISYFNNTNSAGYGILINTPDANNARYALRVNTGAGTVFNVGNGGNVGIGTNSPSEKIELSGSSNVYARITSTTTSANAGLRLNSLGAREYGIFSDGNLRFYDFTSSTERMRITSSGNVGINETNPLAELHVTGSIRSAVNSTAGGNTLIGGINGVSNGHVISTDTSNNITYSWNTGTNARALTINPSGNVGIGTASPGAKLHVYNSNGGDATSKASMLSEAVLKLQPHATNSTNLLFAQVNGGNGIGLQVTNGPATANWDLALSPFGGNVGVGTISPSEKLHVVGNIKATGDVVADCSSDERLKDNINVINNPIDKIKKIKGVEFDWNDKQSTYKGHDIGVIAQDIEKVLPELVNTRDNGYKAVKYDKLTALLIEAVKQQQEQIEKLEKLILKQ